MLQDFGQPMFYTDPKFHASLIWCLPINKNEEKSFSPHQVDSNIENSERQLNLILKEINQEFQLAIENEEVSSAQ